MSDFQHLSETELLSMIEKAETALKTKQSSKRKEVMAKIKELAASIDATVEIYEQGKKATRASGKLPVKYRHPSDSEKTWTGRGIRPLWLKDLLNNGHHLDEFKV